MKPPLILPMKLAMGSVAWSAVTERQKDWRQKNRIRTFLFLSPIFLSSRWVRACFIEDRITVGTRSTADSFLWALQRFYEPRVHDKTGEIIHEARYLNAIWPQVSQIHDLHFGPSHGTFFTPANPLNLEARFGPRPLKTKKPHV
ncbi:hypothetical protein [Prosthecobacter sp.]